MKSIKSGAIGALLMACVIACFAGVASAAELSCTLPTERVNGEPIAAGQLTAITFYGDGVLLASIPNPTACRYTVPSCVGRTYSVTASIGTLTSPNSNTVTVVPVASACGPKPPSGLGIVAAPSRAGSAEYKSWPLQSDTPPSPSACSRVCMG